MAELTPEEKAIINARIATLKTARDSGVLTVRHGDTSTTFRSLDEISTIIDSLETSIIDVVPGVIVRRRVRYPFQVGKGL